MLDQLQSLLNQISVIIEEEKELKKRKYESGETFNVFAVLKLQRDEVRLHSSIIASLLDPKGPHGMKAKLLESFLKVMKGDDILNDIRSIHVEKEMVIGPISKNGEEGGRMDIVLMDKHKNAIVIENKIDAKDQPKQLLRYDNYCRKHFNNYRIYYLTKWGMAPSDESCGRKEVDYWTASYNEDILTWLDECIELSKQVPPVSETIKQYRNNLVDILKLMSQKREKEFLSVVTDDKNIESTLTILENWDSITRKIRSDFLQKLILTAKGYGFVGDKEDAEHLANMKNGSRLLFKSPERSKNYGIYIGKDTTTDGFWYSIETYGKTISRNALQQLEQQWGTFDPQRKRVATPYGWEYFGGESGEQDSEQWSRWDYYDTLRAIHDGRLLSFIEEKILKHTVKHHLLEDLEKAIQ